MTLQATALALTEEPEGSATGEPTSMEGEAFVDDQVDVNAAEDDTLNTA
jgi:hypothetical protein